MFNVSFKFHHTGLAHWDGTSVGSNKQFWCPNIFCGNIHLNIYLKHNMVPYHDSPIPLLPARVKACTFLNSNIEFHKSYVKWVSSPHPQNCSARINHSHKKVSYVWFHLAADIRLLLKRRSTQHMPQAFTTFLLFF